ncbi:unnamed protein product [Umbelopsis ramanniana]
MEAFLSSLPPYVHEFLDKEPPIDVFNVLRELICFAVLYSNDCKNIQRQTEHLLEENAKLQETESQLKEQENSVQANLSGTVIETNQGSPSQKSEEQGSDSNTKSPIPATFPDWWKHLAPPDDSDDKNNNAKENVVDEAPSLPKQDNQVKRSETEQRRRKEDTPPYTAWVPLDTTPSSRPMSTILTSPIARSKPAANTKRHSIAVTNPTRRQSQTSPPPLQGSTHKDQDGPQALGRKAQTVSARLSYLAQPKKVAEPVKTTRSETMPTTIHVAPRNVSLAKPAQTALVKARSLRARTKTEERSSSPVIAPTPAYVQNAKSKIDWEAIKRERRTVPPESVSFEFVPLEGKDEGDAEEPKESEDE